METKLSGLLHRCIAVYNSKNLTVTQMHYRRETAKTSCDSLRNVTIKQVLNINM